MVSYMTWWLAAKGGRRGDVRVSRRKNSCTQHNYARLQPCANEARRRGQKNFRLITVALTA